MKHTMSESIRMHAEWWLLPLDCAEQQELETEYDLRATAYFLLNDSANGYIGIITSVEHASYLLLLEAELQEEAEKLAWQSDRMMESM